MLINALPVSIQPHFRDLPEQYYFISYQLSGNNFDKYILITDNLHDTHEGYRKPRCLHSSGPATKTRFGRSSSESLLSVIRFYGSLLIRKSLSVTWKSIICFSKSSHSETVRESAASASFAFSAISSLASASFASFCLEPSSIGREPISPKRLEMLSRELSRCWKSKKFNFKEFGQF